MKTILMAAISADGFIGKHDSDLSTRWTSKEDTKFFIAKSKELKNLVVGSKTFATFNRKLDERKFFVFSKHTVENLFDNNMEVVNEDPQQFVTRLEQQGVNELMIAGGSSIYSLFMENNLVDEIFLTVEAIIFGDGVKLFNQELEKKLVLLEVIDLSEQTKVLHYKVEK